MIAKAQAAAAPKSASRRRKVREPLDVRLTFRVNFGQAPGDAVTVMNDLSLPMVNSVFDNRDRIMRFLAMTLLRVGMAQPKVVREVFPALRLLRKLQKKTSN